MNNQFIEDVFDRNEFTGAVFIGLIAPYDTVNHQKLCGNLFALTDDYKLTSIANRRFYVELNRT